MERETPKNYDHCGEPLADETSIYCQKCRKGERGATIEVRPARSYEPEAKKKPEPEILKPKER